MSKHTTARHDFGREELLTHMRGLCAAQPPGAPGAVEAAFSVDRRVEIPIKFADGTEAGVHLGQHEEPGAGTARGGTRRSRGTRW